VKRGALIAGIAAGIVAAAAVAIAIAAGGHASAERAPQRTWTAPGGDSTIATPRGWKAVAHGAAATVLERADKRGAVVIRRRAALATPLDRLAGRLERSLRAQLPDFRPAGARLATVGGAQGLVYTFVRPASGRVQSVVVAPAGDRSYTLDLVADGDAPDVARELAGMVRSFAPKR
jgi:hypothetical protein